jgi:hypothetical protein
MAQALVERYESRLHGVLSSYDRVVVTGTLPGACYAEGMTAFLYGKEQLLRALQRPEFNIHGVRRADLISLLPDLSPAALSRELRRLRSLAVIKRVAGTYRYYLTRLGRAAIAAARSFTELRIIPVLAASM